MRGRPRAAVTPDPPGPRAATGKNQQVLGAGGTARVFRGAYRGQPVAVKMMFCVELDAPLVQAFCEEVRAGAGAWWW